MHTTRNDGGSNTDVLAVCEAVMLEPRASSVDSLIQHTDAHGSEH